MCVRVRVCVCMYVYVCMYDLAKNSFGGTDDFALRRPVRGRERPFRDRSTKRVVLRPTHDAPPTFCSRPRVLLTVRPCVIDRSKPETTTKQPACRSGGCRVCLKSFKEGDYSRVCFGCKFKVCEDCATSYTKIDENQDEVSDAPFKPIRPK